MSVPADLPDIAPELEATHTTETSTNLVAEAQPSSAPPVQADFVLGNSQIAPGQRMVVDIPFGKLYTHTELNIGAHIIHGKRPGPVLLITAALHGDEINGVVGGRGDVGRMWSRGRLGQSLGVFRDGSHFIHGCGHSKAGFALSDQR